MRKWVSFPRQYQFRLGKVEKSRTNEKEICIIDFYYYPFSQSSPCFSHTLQNFHSLHCSACRAVSFAHSLNFSPFPLLLFIHTHKGGKWHSVHVWHSIVLLALYLPLSIACVEKWLRLCFRSYGKCMRCHIWTWVFHILHPPENPLKKMPEKKIRSNWNIDTEFFV